MGISVCRADAPYGSHPSGRAVQPRPLRGISDGRSIACLSRFGKIGRTWENAGDGTTVHCRCRELSVSTLLTLSVWAGLPIRTTDRSALTDGLRLAGSGQRFCPKGHRAIADMFCWLATRVGTPMGDDSPVQESADSRQRLYEAVPSHSYQRLLRKGFFDGIASRSLLSLGRFSDAKV